MRPYLKKQKKQPITQKRAGRVAQGASLELKERVVLGAVVQTLRG
jgi:hypothetical protein